MWATLSSPSTRTRPRVMVVFPAAESPTTPRITGRGIASAPGVVVEHGALEDVLRLDQDELVTIRRDAVAHVVVDAVGVPQAGALDRVADAPSVREARPADAALQVGPEGLLGLIT